MIWILVILALMIYIYVKIKQKQSYWEKIGIPHVKPTFFFGIYEITKKRSIAEKLRDDYLNFPNERYYGFYMFMDAYLAIKDPDLLKTMTVKEFDHFLNHRTVVSTDIDPIWANNLVNSEDEKWRHLRATLSPSFTGSKMRIMFTLMDEIAHQFIDYFKSHPSETIEVEMKDALTRYTNDVIATTAFGLRCDSLKDRDNEFYLMGKDVTNMSVLRLLRYMIYNISPSLMKLFDIKVIPPYLANYFSNIIKDTVKAREKQKIVRPDMLHLLMEAMKQHHDGTSTQQEITLDDIISQAFLFFLAGFETISTLLNFGFYELALHPDLQDRLRNEILSVEGDINYDTIKSLKYLDMVISETLRKWTPSILTDRKVSKEFTIEPERPGEKPLHLKVGQICLIPLWALHNDPKLFPNPDRFDPERFNDENKKDIHPFSFIPFGAGPRNCIGNRFALLESKLLMFHVLKNFEVVPVKKTLVPMVLDHSKFGLIPKGGMWLGLKKIN